MRLTSHTGLATAAALAAVVAEHASAAFVPQRYPVKTLNLPLIDPKTACDSLIQTIPALLANASSTHFSEPMEIEYPIAMLYADGDNPTTEQLYAGIPEPVIAPAREQLSAIISSAGDWTRAQIINDQQYGLADATQSVRGGLPAFCRFGANIVTSNSSSTWFETWLPVPANYTGNATTSSSTLSSTSSGSLRTSESASASTSSSASSRLSTSTSSSSLRATTTEAARKRRLQDSVSDSDSSASETGTGAAEGKDSTTDAEEQGSYTALGQAQSTRAQASLTSSSSSTRSASKSSSTSAAPTSTATSGRAPPDNWQGRLVYIGSGGQRGSVSYPDMKQILTRYRQATASSNLGHFGSGSGTTWTIGDPEAQIDFAYRGTHAANLASQLIVQQFYGVDGPDYVGGEAGRVSGTHKHAKSRRSKKTRKLASGAIPHFGFPAYYAGCSTGGRQGMAEANRYPYDFNGILAGSPAVYYNELNAYQIHVNSFQNDSSSPRYIDESLYPVIHQSILDQCDELDGIKDSVLEDPTACKPNLQLLLCAPNTTTTTTTSGAATATSTTSTGSMTSTMSNARRAQHASVSSASTAATTTSRATTTSSSSVSTSANTSTPTYAPAGQCLTQVQIDNLQNIYTTYRYPNGDLIHEPVEYGSETVWSVTDGVVGKAFPPAPGWFQYQVLNRTDSTDDFDYYNEVTFDLIRQGQIANPAGTNTYNANFNTFFAQGSKLIHYHGTADQLIPSGASKRFFRSVKHQFNEDKVGSELSDVYRFFTVPGMGHCRGGDGPWNFGGVSQTVTGARPYRYDALHDMLLALWAWTEDGQTPTHIDAAAYNIQTLGATEPKDYITTPDDNQGYPYGLKFTHRLCPYPRQAIVTDPDNPYRANAQRCGYV